MLHWSNNRLSIDLNNSISLRDGGSSDLWIDIVGYGNITSSLVKLVAMGTQLGGRLDINVSLRLLFLLISTALRLLVSAAQRLRFAASKLRLLVAAALRLQVATALWLMVAALRASAEVVGVTKLSVTAREELLAWVLHIRGKGELLAVQNQRISVFAQLLLSPSALILAPYNVGLGIGKCLVIVLNLDKNVFRAIFDLSSCMLNPGSDIAHVVWSVAYGRLEGFKSYHDLSLRLDSLCVVFLIPDLFVFIKVVDLFIKISTWKFLRRSLRVIWLLVSISNVKARLSIARLLVLIRWDSCGASSKRAYSTGDSKFHNFIYMTLTNIFCLYVRILTNTSVK